MSMDRREFIVATGLSAVGLAALGSKALGVEGDGGIYEADFATQEWVKAVRTLPVSREPVWLCMTKEGETRAYWADRTLAAASSSGVALDAFNYHKRQASFCVYGAPHWTAIIDGTRHPAIAVAMLGGPSHVAQWEKERPDLGVALWEEDESWMALLFDSNAIAKPRAGFYDVGFSQTISHPDAKPGNRLIGPVMMGPVQVYIGDKHKAYHSLLFRHDFETRDRFERWAKKDDDQLYIFSPFSGTTVPNEG